MKTGDREGRRMTKQVAVVMGLLAVTGIAAVAFSNAPEASEPGMQRVKEALNLSAEQTAQLRKVFVEQRKAAIRRQADLKIARIELRELLTAPTVDERAIATKVKELSDLQAAAVKTRVDRMLAIRKVLSADQLEKLKQLRMQHRGWGRRHPGERPGPGGGRSEGGRDSADGDFGAEG